MVNYSDEFNAKAKLNHLQLSMAGIAEEAGLMSLNNVREEDTPKHRREKKNEKRYFDFLQLLTDIQIRLQDFIEEIARELLQARKDLQHYKDMLAEHIALERCIDVLEHDRLLERNPDGSLKDKDLERAVTRYLKDNNMEMDLSDDAKVYAVAQNVLPTYPTRNQLRDVIHIQNEIVSTCETGKDQALDFQHKLDDPNLSNQELIQISKDVNKLLVYNKSRTAIFTNEKNEILNSVQSDLQSQPSLKHTILPQSIGIKPLDSTSLPTPNMNF